MSTQTMSSLDSRRDGGVADQPVDDLVLREKAQTGYDLLRRYRDTGEMNDLNTAVQKLQEVVDLTPGDHPDRALWLQISATSLGSRYQRLGDLKDLEATVQRFQEAVHLTPPDHPDRANRLKNLSVSLRDQYQRFGDLQDLKAALQRDQEAVDLTAVDHPDRAGRLQNLGTSFMDQYQRLGDLMDLEAAVQKFQEVVDMTPGDHPDRAGQLQSLAFSLGNRYQRLGELRDLEAAVQRFQEAVDSTPADHPDRASRLQNLAVSLKDRYRRLGKLKDLEVALEKDQEAVDITPVEHPERARWLQSLATSFSIRYHWLGKLTDLEAALQNGQEAVKLTPVDHPDRARQLKCLAGFFKDRYQRLGELKDLEAALQKDQEAVGLTPVNHPERAVRMDSLAASFGTRYRRLGELKDLEAAIQRFEEAVDLTPGGHPDMVGCLQNLAISFRERHERLGELKDLEAAVQRDQEAMDLTPEDHPDKASQLQSLAESCSGWYKRFQEKKYLKLVHHYYQVSFNTLAPSDPEPSWEAALRWALFSKKFQPAYCSTAYLAAFNLLPQLLWIGHSIPVRQDAIHRLDIGKTASAATRISLTLSDPVSAVQFFEQGLATTFQQMLQLRPDLDMLSAEYAEKLEKLSYELYSGTSDNPSRVARERQELLQDIRKQPGLEHFLLPQPYRVLCYASQGGPVLILNSHEDGCDGIIILNPNLDPVHVPLPNVTVDLLKFWQRTLKELLRHCNVRTRGESVSTRLFGHREGFRSRTTEEHFTDLLTWLWNNVVEPVYQALALHGIHNGRLWWLPSGLFTGLPLHACPPTDEFVHSYTAILGSLLEARAKKTVTTQHRVGVVGVTHTSIWRANYLKGVEEEVQKISAVIKDPNLRCLEGEQATPTAVLNLLQDCSWVHLACHGTQDPMEPTKSHLLLYEGVLELETILRMPLLNAEFVFLAACQTAMGDADLVNESFHLTGGFIAAGFRGAIGTLWSMDDQDGPLVAETFYSYLFRDGRQPQASDAAEALQFAMNKLKAQKVPYQRWIPFIHMGV
ncbi:CHAT domain-containing protein [Mycena maculata]|uniref:CHAT domain-containing protein n=1 Tax=Mycena maculata TaxID=230809 RepID=A0AAD7MLV3_9AGAR|nr:CHAT domain-containing protein [Mycena maculata]